MSPPHLWTTISYPQIRAKPLDRRMSPHVPPIVRRVAASRPDSDIRQSPRRPPEAGQTPSGTPQFFWAKMFPVSPRRRHTGGGGVSTPALATGSYGQGHCPTGPRFTTGRFRGQPNQPCRDCCSERRAGQGSDGHGCQPDPDDLMSEARPILKARRSIEDRRSTGARKPGGRMGAYLLGMRIGA